MHFLPIFRNPAERECHFQACVSSIWSLVAFDRVQIVSQVLLKSVEYRQRSLARAIWLDFVSMGILVHVTRNGDAASIKYLMRLGEEWFGGLAVVGRLPQVTCNQMWLHACTFHLRQLVFWCSHHPSMNGICPRASNCQCVSCSWNAFFSNESKRRARISIITRPTAFETQGRPFYSSSWKRINVICQRIFWADGSVNPNWSVWRATELAHEKIFNLFPVAIHTKQLKFTGPFRFSWKPMRYALHISCMDTSYAQSAFTQ